jgi:hypothetical protein
VLRRHRLSRLEGIGTFYPMTRDYQHNPDPNVNAARIVAESTKDESGLPAGLEAAWAEAPKWTVPVSDLSFV